MYLRSQRLHFVKKVTLYPSVQVCEYVLYMYNIRALELNVLKWYVFEGKNRKNFGFMWSIMYQRQRHLNQDSLLIVLESYFQTPWFWTPRGHDFSLQCAVMAWRFPGYSAHFQYQRYCIAWFCWMPRDFAKHVCNYEKCCTSWHEVKPRDIARFRVKMHQKLGFPKKINL